MEIAVILQEVTYRFFLHILKSAILIIRNFSTQCLPEGWLENANV